VRRRSTAEPPPGSAAGVLLACEREADAAGDDGRLAAVRSWRAMLRAAGNDPEVAGLFAAFALEEDG